ncbi:MAG: PEP-CTERM sorting domain-containing protein [Candidatus Hydrogenedentes bacterium]|nr:PEP-CTERM sorting domain-containing protein [Candidatus Hydrogenedentota bacterium]
MQTRFCLSFTFPVGAAISSPVFATITADSNGNVQSEFNLFQENFTSPASLEAVFDGPAGSTEPVAKIYTDGEASTAKSLAAFANGNKHGWHNWHGWDWGDWNWNDWHDWHDNETNVVPEPASMAVMGMGLAALAVRRRFRK